MSARPGCGLGKMVLELRGCSAPVTWPREFAGSFRDDVVVALVLCLFPLLVGPFLSLEGGDSWAGSSVGRWEVLWLVTLVCDFSACPAPFA